MSLSGEKTIAALIVAAGRGTRAGGEIPKQWQPLAGRRVIDWTLEAFRTHPRIGIVAVVVHPDDREHLKEQPDIQLIDGGSSRTISVRNGLEALAKQPPQKVLIHDAARPCVSKAIIDGVISQLEETEAAAPGLAVTDALWRGDSKRNVISAHPRDGLWRAQTPQGFRFSTILEAHRKSQLDASDDVETARAADVDVAITEGHTDNLKITTAADFIVAENILRADPKMDTRIGNGFDVHRFGSGDSVILCGIEIPHDRGLKGHSDADVGLHAITDAIYGALAEGDIGQHFPPSDPNWKGANSSIFLEHAALRAKSRGYVIQNVDCTLICEAPKIAQHSSAMRTRVAEILNTDPGRVSVKATTTEGLGFAGRKEGIACMATVTLGPK